MFEQIMKNRLPPQKKKQTKNKKQKQNNRLICFSLGLL